MAIELQGGHGISARVLTLGATLQSLWLPDREGRIADVVLGFDDGGRYATEGHYLGSTIGRYANRIAGGRFTLDGVEHRLPANDGAHHLHGGPEGFHRRMWTVEEIGEGEVAFVRLSLVSLDGDAGYPGTLRAEATYALSADGLAITYRATTDAPTVVGMTNHAYFNLAGAGGDETVLGHRLTIAADGWLPVAPGAIPDRRALRRWRAAPSISAKAHRSARASVRPVPRSNFCSAAAMTIILSCAMPTAACAMPRPWSIRVRAG